MNHCATATDHSGCYCIGYCRLRHNSGRYSRSRSTSGRWPYVRHYCMIAGCSGHCNCGCCCPDQYCHSRYCSCCGYCNRGRRCSGCYSGYQNRRCCYNSDRYSRGPAYCNDPTVGRNCLNKTSFGYCSTKTCRCYHGSGCCRNRCSGSTNNDHRSSCYSGLMSRGYCTNPHGYSATMNNCANRLDYQMNSGRFCRGLHMNHDHLHPTGGRGRYVTTNWSSTICELDYCLYITSLLALNTMTN